MFLNQFPAGFQFQNNFLETPIFFFHKHFPDIISLGNRRKGGEKMVLITKAIMGVLKQLRSLVWHQTVIALKSGKIYVLLRLLVKHWIQDPNIFHYLINYMIYHMSFPWVQFLFIDYNVRDVTWHKSYSQMATNQFSYNNDYISSMLNCEAILLLITFLSHFLRR